VRILIKVSMPVESANEVVRSGKLGETIESILAEQKPEAAYFTEMDGRRTGIIIVDVSDPSQIPALAEPYFLAFNAQVEFHPAMTPADLEKAGPAIEQAVRKYGRIAPAALAGGSKN
jgi:hypothetical protein